MKELSLFSGAGGGLLGTYLLGWRPVGYVEIDEYCQRVIAARIKDGILSDAPIFGNIHSFLSDGYAASYSGLVDVITAGFPCQPFSNAGKRLGADDPRNGWPATIECLRVVRPHYALLENVPGLLTSGYFGTVLGDLAACGFDCRWRILSAAEVGAPHRRDRLWICAYAKSERTQQLPVRSGQSQQASIDADRLREDVPYTDSVGQRKWENQQECITERHTAPNAGAVGQVADANQIGRHGRAGQLRSGWGRQSENGGCTISTYPERKRLEIGHGPTGERAQPAIAGGDWWAVEPDVGRVANGMASRVDRLKALGNGQVPAVVRAAWMLLNEIGNL